MAEPRSTRTGTAVGRTAELRMNLFVPKGRQEAVDKWGPKIRSFRGTIEYDRTDSPSYMEETARAALRHFGLDGNVSVQRERGFYNTVYRMYVDGHEVSGYRVYGGPGNPDYEKIGANLEGMVEDAVIYKMGKDGDALTNALGRIDGMESKWKWIGPRR